MPPDNKPEHLAKPLVRKSRFSLVWLLPLLTAVIGIWLTVKTISEQGPEITLTFASADGVEAGKTRIKYKEIDLGVVESVQFSEDFSHVVLTARMAREAASFLRRDSLFWVVKPHLSLRGVSGLSTLISGSYIEMTPGHGDSWRDFEGLDEAPVVKTDVEGKKFTLLTNKLGSIETGSPIYYQGIQAGEVLGYDLSNDKKNLLVYAFVKAPFDQLVNSSSRFWNVSGLDISVDSEGFKIHSDSLLAIMLGGIAFETPAPTVAQQELDLEGLVYTLYDNHQQIMEEAFTRKLLFVAFFEGSVRGLEVGASVELKGIKVGTVKDIRLEVDLNNTSFRIPVVLEIEPERIVSNVEGGDDAPYALLKTLVDKGLRAQLQTGSLLTGQLFVELGIFPDTPVRLLGLNTPYPELPTVPGSLEQITDSIKNIIAKVEKVNIDKIGKDLQDILEGTNQLIKSPEVHTSVSELRSSLKLFTRILTKLENRVEPIAENLEKTLGSGHRTLEKFQNTMHLLDTLLDPDAPLQYRFIEMNKALSETARSVRSLVDMLERNPNAVIFGKEPPGGK